MRCVVLFVLLLIFGLAGPAEARIYCPLPEHGVWVNPDAKAKEITRIEIETKCENDQVYARIRAFTQCSPRDCKWGWTEAEVQESGGLRVLLVGFLSSKLIEVRRFGDMLDTHVFSVTHDGKNTAQEDTYNLIRK